MRCPPGCCDAVHDAEPPGIRVGARVASVEAVDVRAEEEVVRIDERRRDGREGIVVAEAKLRDGDGVVLIDDGDAVELVQERK